MLKNKALITPLGLVGITILSGVFLMSSITSATDNTDVVDNVSIEVPISCSLEGTGMTSHNANIVNGTYQADIGSTTLKVFCNDDEGFAIYAIGYTNEEYGNTNLIGTNSNQTIVTGTATSTGNPDVSNWAMKLATVSSPTPAYPITIDNSFSSYHVVPSPYAKVAHRDSGTDVGNNATGSELTATYAAYMSKTQAADTYSGKVKYTLVHPSSEVPLQPQPATAGCINYFANGSNVVGGMGCQTVANNTSRNLWASNFSRAGYGFAGWNTKFDYSGITYGPNEAITTPADVETNGLSLYAVWVKSAGTLQNWSGCSSLAQGSVTALTDSRDNDTYAVAKLADGNCWMIENLRLDNTASHNTDGSLAQGYNSSFIGLADPESANFTNSTTANSLYSTDGTTDATISGSGWYQEYRFPRYNNSNTNSRQSGPWYTDTNNTYSYGNYYTWHAAIADTTYYGTKNQSIISTSLCPAGWRLPKGGDSSNATNSDLWNLGTSIMGFPPSNNTNYQSSETNIAGDTATEAFRKYPNNFLYSGGFDGSSAINRGGIGHYWSSTVGSNSASYRLVLNSQNVVSGANYSNKTLGYTIRCTLGS